MTSSKPFLNAEKCKKCLSKKLPIFVDNFKIRELERNDIDLYASWPDYSPPYDIFNTSLKTKPFSERDWRWKKYCSSNESLSLVIDHEKDKVIGKFSLFNIDWEEKIINNMGIRLHPEWCNKGIGSKLLKVISEWCFNNGISKIKFDVLSTNQRAVAAYRKVGYEIKDKFKHKNALFYWMELSK